MAERLTTTTVRSLEARERDYEVMDATERGLGIRVTRSGRKSWIYRYRFDGALRRIRLGTFPTMDRQAAVNAYYTQRSLAHDHRLDPLAVRQEAEEARKAEAQREGFTVRRLVDEYIEVHARPKKRSWEFDRDLLEREIPEAWWSAPAGEITRGRVRNELIRPIEKRGSPRTAALVVAALRKAYNVALDAELVESNPCVRMALQKAGRRERTLSVTELRTLLAGLDSAFSAPVAAAIRLILWTAARRGEVAGVEWREIDQQDAVWRLPEARSKNGYAHNVMLPTQAVAFLKGHRKAQGRGKHRHVFPSREGHLQGHTITEAITRAIKGRPERKQKPAFKLDRFTPHDLRRTVLTHLARHGCPRVIQDRIANHVDFSVAAIYDRHSYDPEARQWLQAWADYLDAVAAGTDGQWPEKWGGRLEQLPT